jgi:hypothetical protein
VPSDAGSTTSSKRAKFGSQLAVDTPASSVIGTDMEVSFPYTGEASDDEDMSRRPPYHRTATQSTSKGFVEEDSETPTRQLGTKTLQLKNNRLDKQDAETVQRKNNRLDKDDAGGFLLVTNSFDEDEPEELDEPVELDEDGASIPSAKIELKLAVRGLGFGALYKMRASQLATTVDDIDTHPDHYRFRCPIDTCGVEFNAKCNYETFVEHVNTYRLELFESGIYVCPFGCSCGFNFVSIFAAMEATHSPLIQNSYKLEPQQCRWEGCRTKCPTLMTMQSHWLKKHSFETYEDDATPFKGHICKRGFAEEYSYYKHITADIGEQLTLSHLILGQGTMSQSSFTYVG